MHERRTASDLEPLDRLLAALGQGVAHRVLARTRERPQALTASEAVRAAWRNPAVPVQVATLPRGVPLDVVLRAVLRHFLPGAAAVVLPLFTLLLLLNPFDWMTNVPVLLGVLGLATAGFGLGLGALSHWLFPHSNPDGQRSDVAGLASPFVTLAAGGGLFRLIGPLSTAAEFVAIWSVAALSGFALALVSYAPWLKPTSRIAQASPVKRWAMLRATVSMGAAGSGTFGLAYLALAVWDGFRAGHWGMAGPLTQGVINGFLIGVLFAVVLWWVHRRESVDQLRAVRVGLLGALAAALPAVALVTLRAFFWDIDPQLPHPMAEVVRAFFALCIPGFLLAYWAVRLAQTSGHDRQ